ncbi:MAG: DUF4416 family protein [Candidatus Marinimicrobia bacterium]|nr:DUF4416 family protein [Candidatus Neomarinimicrobiota bacterium]MCF7827429.1 DUF4416 family protein [Candidatus Neomarinimicrobiota bacterium]MCF7881338.1 DUF4416 family protein [Candidatus Neomarinimicrobiota bacterium]
MQPTEPDPVKLFIGVLYSDEQRMEQALKIGEESFSAVDYRSETFPFEVTDYYADEMGTPIFRMFVSFTELVNPGILASAKIRCNEIEETAAVDGERTVNLDIGYMDFHKVVLASAKFNGQKIYLDYGIYADPTLYYRKGSFHPYDWSFPDFKESDRYYESLLEIRNIYKKQMKN